MFYDAIILGGGVSGLACADEILAHGDKKVLVLEKSGQVGGLAKTIRDGHFNYDLSPHRWFTKNEELNRWFAELAGKDIITVKKNTPMYQMGRFFKYPIKVGDVLLKMNPVLSAYIVSTYIFGHFLRKMRSRKPETMKDAYLLRFGSGIYNLFNREYNEKLWGKGGCDYMSADFVDQRVKNLSIMSAILNSFGLNKNKVISLVDEFLYPKKGVGTISEKLHHRILRNRGDVRLGEEAVSIKKLGNKYRITTSKNTYECRHIVNTIPLCVFIKSFENGYCRKILKYVNRLEFVHQKVVVLMASKPKLTDYTWVYVHPKKIKTFRFMETNNWSPGMSPKGKTSLVFEYPYQKGDDIDRMTDRELIALTINDFIKYFSNSKAIPSDFIRSKVHRVNYAYPKYDLNYGRALKKIYKFADRHLPNVILAGRNGMFRYNNLDHSVFTGLLAARNILAGKKKYDLRKVNNEAEYHEEMTVAK